MSHSKAKALYSVVSYLSIVQTKHNKMFVTKIKRTTRFKKICM